MEKPIKEWLKELPEPIRELAIKRREESDLGRVNANSVSDAIWHSFTWSDTKEGFDFWEKWHVYILINTDENDVFTDPKDYSGLPMPDGFSLQNEPVGYFGGPLSDNETVYAGVERSVVFMGMWKPVTEKTPANNQKVLVCWSHTPVWEPSQAYYVDGKFYPDRGAAPYFRVTHWMEMPKGVQE